MAKFNPDIPKINEPSYLGLSKPISQPEGDRSAAFEGQAKGFAAENTGNLFALATKGADETYKAFIDNDAEAARRERDDYLKKLETDKALTGQNVQDPTTAPAEHGLNYTAADAAGTSLAAAPSKYANVPKPIREGVQTLAQMDDARANGKMSPTLYYGRLNEIAKALRERYPGYKDFVDRQISEITGVDPANAYMRSLIGDINAATSGQDPERKRIETLAFSANGQKVPNMPQLLTDYYGGKDPGGMKLFGAVVAQESEENRLKTIELQMRTAKGAEGMVADTYEKGFNGIASGVVTKFTNGVAVANKSPAEIAELLAKRQRGEINLTDPEVTKMIGDVDVAIRSAEAEIDAAANKQIKRSDGSITTVSEMLGPEKVQKIKGAAMSNMNEFRKSLASGDFPAASYYANLAKSMQGQTLYKLVTDQNIGSYFQTIKAMRDMGGDQWVANYNMSALKLNIDQGLAAFVHKLGGDMIAEGDALSGKIKANMGTGAPPPSQAVANEHLLKALDIIEDKKANDLGKTNAIKAIVTSPGVTNLFDKDVIKDGRRIPGKYALFERLTTPEKVKEIYRLTENDQTLRQSYINWAGGEFARLFRSDINELSGMKGNVRYVVPNDKKLAPYFEITNGDTNFTNTVMRRVNWGLAAMHNAGTPFGVDTSSQAYKLLESMGYKATAPADSQAEIKQKVLDFGQAMSEALASPFKQTPTIFEGDKSQQKPRLRRLPGVQ